MAGTAAAAAFAEALNAAGGVDLLRAAVAAGIVAYPLLDVPATVHEVERLAIEIRFEIGETPGGEPMLPGLHHALFEKRGFRGNTEDYYDPRNCYLHEVLARRTGMPVALSILYMDLGTRLGLQVAGIGFPAHFIVRVGNEPARFRYIDPFNRGQEVTPTDLAAFLERQGGRPERQLELFLAAVTPRQILARLLANLKGIYINQANYLLARGIVELLLVLTPWAFDELRDRGLLSAYLGDDAAAAADLSAYLDASPEAPDAARVRERLRQIQGGM